MEFEKKKSRGKGCGAEYKYKLNNFNCYYGTIHKTPCVGIFFGTNTYVMPNTDYIKDVNKFKIEFEKFMNHNIKCIFQGTAKHMIYSIEDRVNNTANRINTSFTLLPIEVTVLFNSEVIYKEQKDKIQALIKIMINYLQSYKELVFDNIIYK